MRSPLNIKTVGWSVSATLAVIYVLVMLASLLLVSRLTTGSWPAAFLGIGLSTIAGFELGFLAVVIAGFSIAAVFTLIYNLAQNLRMGRVKTAVRSSLPVEGFRRTWQFRLFTACLVFPTLILVVLRLMASFSTMGVAAGQAGETIPDAGDPMKPVLLSSVINTAHREAEPSFTADGQTMYFNCNSGDICVSRLVGSWEAGNWTQPERLGTPINTAYEEVEPVINGAGDKLYFSSIRPGGRLNGIPFLSPFMSTIRLSNSLAIARLGRTWLGGLGLPDVYVSYRVDGAWSEPIPINQAADEPPVNTSFDDHCLFFSADGNEAFWTSTRPGGFGENDIWTSRRVAGKWTEPENLGPNINSSVSEHTSIPTPDGRYLYVTTTRAEGYGGEDNYITERGPGGKWGPLVNLGPFVNGPGDDRCPAWTPDLKYFLFDSVREGGFGGRDIWWVYFEEVLGYSQAVTTQISTTGTTP